MDNIYCVQPNDNDNKMSTHFTHYADEITPSVVSTSIKCFSCVCILNCKIGLSSGFHPISSGPSQLPTIFLTCDKNRIYFESTTWRWADVLRVFQRIYAFFA